MKTLDKKLGLVRVLAKIDKFEDDFNTRTSDFMQEQIVVEIRRVRAECIKHGLEEIIFGNGTFYARFADDRRYYVDDHPYKLRKLFALCEIGSEFGLYDISINDIIK